MRMSVRVLLAALSCLGLIGLFDAGGTTVTRKQIGKADFATTRQLFAAGKMLYSIDDAGNLYRINTSNGARDRVGDEGVWQGTQVTAVMNDKVYSVGPDGSLRETNLATGKGTDLAKPEGARTRLMAAGTNALFTIDESGNLYEASVTPQATEVAAEKELPLDPLVNGNRGSGSSDNGAAMKRVTGIGGVFFKSKDPKALGAWYKTHLGIDVEDWGGAAFRWNGPENPQGGGTTVWSPFAADTKYFAPSTASFMINYRVEDLHALLAALRAEGVQVAEKVQESEDGKFGWIIDPDGNKLELWQPPPGK